MKGRFLSITDTHFALSSNTRTGDLLDDLIVKLDWCVDYCNEHDLILLASGDIFDKPTVPDLVKTRVIKSLKRAKNNPLFIKGNHDRLYASDEYLERTSYNLLVEAGFVLDVEKSALEFDDCVVTAQRPLLNHPSNKPQINLWHGFLNQEDGLSTFMLDDIISDTNNIVILGHDHIPYDPVNYKNTVVYRPGSFCRAIRNDSSDRIPQALKITSEGGTFRVEEVAIATAKPVELLFKVKPALQEKTSIDSYTDIVELLKNDKKGVSIYDALNQVTNQATVEHIRLILND